MEEAHKIINELDDKSFRHTQFNKAFYKELVEGWDEITTLSLSIRNAFKKDIPFSTITARNSIDSEEACKVLFQTHDDQLIESVLIYNTQEDQFDNTEQESSQGKHSTSKTPSTNENEPADRNAIQKNRQRFTVCVSTQVGCPIRCIFCETGKIGFKRNLTTREIVDQVLYFARKLKKEGKKITNVVYMGMGEPLLNFENTIESAKILTSEEMFGLGKRKLVISTVAPLEPLERLYKMNLGLKTAISLHTPSQAIREALIPIAQTNPIHSLIKLLTNYTRATKQRINIEYILLKDINSTNKDAKELADLLAPIKFNCFVNLIQYNSTSNKNLKGTSTKEAFSFAETLRKYGISCYIRFSKASSLSGACGQLAAKAS